MKKHLLKKISVFGIVIALFLSACSKGKNSNGTSISEYKTGKTSYSTTSIATADELGIPTGVAFSDGFGYISYNELTAEGGSGICVFDSDNNLSYPELPSSSNFSILCICPADNGGIWLSANMGDNHENNFKLCKITDNEFSVVRDIGCGEHIQPIALCLTTDKLLIELSDFQENTIISCCDLAGNEISQVNIGKFAHVVTDGENVFVGKESADEQSYGVGKLDLNTYEISEVTKFDGGYLIGCKGNKLYLYDETGPVEYDIISNASSRLFKWSSCGLTGRNVKICNDDNDGFIISSIDGVKHVIVSEKGTKGTLTLAVNGPGMYSQGVLDFNENSNDYEVQVKDYSSYEDPLLILSTEILGGDCPDIIDVTSFSTEILNPNAMIDLMTFLDGKNDVKCADLFQAPLNAMKDEKGRLLAIAPRFYVGTCLYDRARTETSKFVNVQTSLARLGDPSAAFGGVVSRDDFLSLAFCSGDISNYTQDELQVIIEYAKNLPESHTRENIYPIYSYGYFGGPGSVINYVLDSGVDNYSEIGVLGLPFREGTGEIIPVSSYSIPLNANDPNGAWTFIEHILMLGGDPYNEYSLLTAAQSVSEKEVEDFYINGPTIRYEFNGEQLEKKFTKNEYKEIAEVSNTILNGVNGIYCPNDKLYGIILNSVGAFFAGDKLPNQAADELKSKLDIYLAEQYS